LVAITSLNVGIHYLGKLAALQAKKEGFEGSKSMTRTVIWRCQPKRITQGIKIHNSKSKATLFARISQTEELRPLAREAWRHRWPVRNNLRDKNPQLE
jgi:hypothetical protein